MLLAVVLAAGCATASPPIVQGAGVTVKGLVALGDDGAIDLVECESKRKFAIGAMAPGQYLYLRRRVGELGTPGRGPVTAEVTGRVIRVNGQLWLERPAILGLAAGDCVELPDYGDRDY